METTQRCDGCGEELPSGVPRWLLRIGLTADFDGQLDPDAGRPGELERLLARLSRDDGPSETELSNEVHQNWAYVLCGRCRRSFVADPLAVTRPAHRSKNSSGHGNH